MKIAIFDCPVILINNPTQIICPLILSMRYPLNFNVNVIILGGLKYVKRQDMQVLLHTTGMNNRRNCLVISKPLDIAAREKVCKTFQSKAEAVKFSPGRALVHP